MEHQLPRQFGMRYLLESETETNSISKSYIAKDIVLNRRVIIRIWHGFLQEAQIMAKCKHPNVALVYEYGEQPQPHLAIEYIDGKSLFDLIASHELKLDQAITIVERCADAIHIAHSQNILHLNLNSKNIIIQHHEPKLTDFSWAMFLTTSRLMLTQIPTADYLAPELIPNCPQFSPDDQVIAEHWSQRYGIYISPRTDVYSLGAILYHAITGCLPFSNLAISNRLSNPIPPRRLDTQISKDLEAICLKCLSPLPQDRYIHAGELAQDLRNLQTNRPIQARHAGIMYRTKQWFRRHPTISTAIFLILLTNMFILLLFSVPQWWRLYQARRIQNLCQIEANELNEKIAQYQQQSADILKKIEALHINTEEIETQTRKTKSVQIKQLQNIQKLLQQLRNIQEQTNLAKEKEKEDQLGEKRAKELAQEQIDMLLADIQKSEALQKQLMQELETITQSANDFDEQNLAYETLRQNSDDTNNNDNSSSQEKKESKAGIELLTTYNRTQYALQTWKFEITCANTGLITLTNVQLTLRWNTLIKCNFAELNPILDNQQALWKIPKLVPGESKNFAIHFIAGESGIGDISAGVTTSEEIYTNKFYSIKINELEAKLTLYCPAISYISQPSDVKITVSNPLTIPLTDIDISAQWTDEWKYLNSTGNPQVLGVTAVWKIHKLDPQERQTIELKGTSEHVTTTEFKVKVENTQGLNLETNGQTSWIESPANPLKITMSGLSTSAIYKDHPARLEYYISVNNATSQNITNLKLYWLSQQDILWIANNSRADIERGIWRCKPEPIEQLKFTSCTSKSAEYILPTIEANEIFEFRVCCETQYIGSLILQVQAIQNNQILNTALWETQVRGIPDLKLNIQEAELNSSKTSVKIPFYISNYGNGSAYDIQLKISCPAIELDMQRATFTLSGSSFSQNYQNNCITCHISLVGCGSFLVGNINIPVLQPVNSEVLFSLSSESSSFVYNQKVPVNSTP